MLLKMHLRGLIIYEGAWQWRARNAETLFVLSDFYCTNVSTSSEHLREIVERGLRHREKITLTGPRGHSSEQAVKSENEGTSGTRTLEEDRQDQKIFQQRAQIHVKYSWPISRKLYHYVSGIVQMAYNPFIPKDIPDCSFDYERALLLRYWKSGISTIRSNSSQQVNLGPVREERVTSPFIGKSDIRVEFGLGFLNKLLRTSLIGVWDLMKPLWCPRANNDVILRVTNNVQRDLSMLIVICATLPHNFLTAASRSNREKTEENVELPG